VNGIPGYIVMCCISD